jgi:hypothetical protein
MHTDHPFPLASTAPASGPRLLRDVALARSGDKGNRATLSVVALDPAHYPLLAELLTEDRVRQQCGGIVQGRIDRYPLPHLAAIHFVLHDALAGGVTRSLALDAHGKSLSSLILALPLNGE